MTIRTLGPPWRDMPLFLYPGTLNEHQTIWVMRSLSQLERADDLRELVTLAALRATFGLTDGDEVSMTWVGCA